MSAHQDKSLLQTEEKSQKRSFLPSDLHASSTSQGDEGEPGEKGSVRWPRRGTSPPTFVSLTC